MAEMLTITNPMANCSVGLMEKSGEASRGVQEFDEAGQEVDSIAMNSIGGNNKEELDHDQEIIIDHEIIQLAASPLNTTIIYIYLSTYRLLS